MGNNSTTPARINTLPPEILARIFALAKLYCVHEKHAYRPLQFHGFTDVCHYWRQIATDTTDLWSHIDIGPSTPTSLTRLLLERTRDSPIHIHFYEPRPPSILSLSQESYRVVPILKPHILRVRSLDLESDASSIKNVDSMLNLWLDYGSMTLPRSLLVRRPICSPLISIDKEGGSGTRQSRSENLRGALSSVRTLHLQGVVLPWDSGAYYGLTDLTLDFWTFYVHIPQSLLAGVLSASPMLTILKLSHLMVTRTEDWNQHTPIVLGSLKILDLWSMPPDSLGLLLPSIVLPDPPNDVAVSIQAYERIQSPLGAFFARSHMKTLDYHFRGKIPAFETPLLGSLPRVDGFLVLSGFYIPGTQPTRANPAPRPPSTHFIRNVILLSCFVTSKGLKELVDKFQIRNLRLAECEVPSWDQSLEDIKSLLLETHPGLDCVISSQDSSS